MVSDMRLNAKSTMDEIVATGKKLLKEANVSNVVSIPKEYVITEHQLKPVMTILNKVNAPIAKAMSLGLGVLPEVDEYLIKESDKKEDGNECATGDISRKTIDTDIK